MEDSTWYMGLTHYKLNCYLLLLLKTKAEVCVCVCVCVCGGGGGGAVKTRLLSFGKERQNN
jgi:hypothetical protein